MAAEAPRNVLRSETEEVSEVLESQNLNENVTVDVEDTNTDADKKSKELVESLRSRVEKEYQVLAMAAEASRNVLPSEAEKEISEVLESQNLNENVTGDGEDTNTDVDKKSKELVECLRSRVEKEYQGVNDDVLRRFLITNEMDVDKAVIPLLSYVKWRQSFSPLGYIHEEEIANECKKEKLCLQGHDKKGRTIGVFLVVRHDAFDRDLEEFKRYIVYAFDKAISSTKHELLELVVIVDLAGWGFKSVDVRGYLALLDILQEHYLKHLGKMVLIHVPYIFWAAWKVTSPFFNEFTRERMMFVEDKNMRSVLLEEIDEDQLPEIYGGKLALQPV